jgi:hypothetical protein
MQKYWFRMKLSELCARSSKSKSVGFSACLGGRELDYLGGLELD